MLQIKSRNYPLGRAISLIKEPLSAPGPRKKRNTFLISLEKNHLCTQQYKTSFKMPGVRRERFLFLPPVGEQLSRQGMQGWRMRLHHSSLRTSTEEVPKATRPSEDESQPPNKSESSVHKLN